MVKDICNEKSDILKIYCFEVKIVKSKKNIKGTQKYENRITKNVLSKV